MTGIQLTVIKLIDNDALKKAIQSWKQEKAAAKATGRQADGLAYPVIQVRTLQPYVHEAWLCKASQACQKMRGRLRLYSMAICWL